MIIAERIKALRRIRGLTQEELATASSFSVSTVGRLERSEAKSYNELNSSQVTSITRISISLKVSPNFILCTNDNGSISGPFNIREYKRIFSGIKSEFMPTGLLSPLRFKSSIDNISTGTEEYSSNIIRKIMEEEYRIIGIEYETMTNDINYIYLMHNEECGNYFTYLMDTYYSFLSDIWERKTKLEKMIVEDLKKSRDRWR